MSFAERSCGGWFKGKDPTVPREALIANWVDGAEVAYIGKADQLKRRLTQFADFGAGKPIGHWGARLIWQLPNIGALLVAWKETPGRVPVEVEAELIEQFRLTYGKPPFANDPHRLKIAITITSVATPSRATHLARRKLAVRDAIVFMLRRFAGCLS